MIRGNWSYHEARRHASPILSSPQDVHGAFCLYLRSFEDDNRLAQAQSLPLLHTAIRFLFSIGYTEEQQLVKAISSVAPVVALGAPGELVPYAGAQRMYLPGEGWQEIVRDLMLRARLVVVVLGSGAGIRWELGQALRVLPPERLVLLVPMRRDEYEQFRRAMAAPLSAEGKRHNTARRSSVPQLPSYGGDGELTSTIQSLISFSAGWEPTARPLRRYAWYGNFLYGAISRELAVVVTRLGEDEQAPRWPLVTDSETFARAAGVVSGLAIIVSIFAGGLATVSAISVVVSGLWLVFVVLYRRRDSEAL